MVVQGILALALALPTGLLFGVGYGTGVRIGYEQVYPLLFPKGATSTDSEQLQTNMKAINTIYNTIGGKEASNMGIAQGLNNARTELENNPDFQWLEELASRLSGPTPSSSVNLNQSGGTPSSLPAIDRSRDADILNKTPSAETVRKITDIPSLMRLIDRLEALAVRTSNDNYIIAVARAQIKKLRDSSTSLTIQQQNQQQLDTRTPAETIQNRISTYRDATSEEQEYNTWRTVLTGMQQQWLQAFNALTSSKRLDATIRIIYTKQMALASANIRKVSQDYRNPNNIIRKFVLLLRQEIANGNYKSSIL